MHSKTILITGAARRIGATIARFIHAKNNRIIIHYNKSENDAKRLAAELNSHRPDSAAILYSDLNNNIEVIQLAEKAFSIWKSLDGLVNNASRFYASPMGNITEEIWEDLLASNLKAPFFLAQSCAKYLKEQQGCIVNITDIHAERALKNYPVYSIAKAGLAMLTKTLAKELGPEIRVNAVAPGPIIWPEGNNILNDATKAQIINQIPLKRTGTPEEIAKAVWFLMNDATYTTGQIIAVDGGRNLSLG